MDQAKRISEEAPPVVVDQKAAPTATNDSFLNKPLSESWPIGLFLVCVIAAFKEIWSARVSPQFKLVVTVAIAAFEYGLYALTGINPADPQIVPLASVNVPVVGVAAGFGFFVKIAHT